MEQYIEGVMYVTKFFWKMEKLTLRAKFETIFKQNFFFLLKLH